jgi:hydrogenase maturation protease
MNLAVIALGQPLRGDDGAGAEALRLWMTRHPVEAQQLERQLLFLETPGLGLLDELSGAGAALLIDSISSGAPAGTVRVWEELPEEKVASAEKTAHGFGFLETITLARKSGTPLPERICLIGIEAGSFALGVGLTPEVRAALPRAVEEIDRMVRKLAF